MTLFLSSCFPSCSHISPCLFPVLHGSFKPISSSIRAKPFSPTIPARDRIIDFGKYKGKMLGTLPSKYIKWVSKTLRARDFEEWAKLADEVLQDPVYRDRLEWEVAENLLNGNSPRGSMTESPVSDLLEISERFGWNNEDKIGWSKIDFALLGTSKGGRIPRIGDSKIEKQKKFRVSQVGGMGSSKKNLGQKREAKSSSLSAGSMVSKNEEVCDTWNGDLGRLRIESRFSDSEKLGFKEQGKMRYLKNGLKVSVDTDEEESFEDGIGVRLTREERRERQRLKRGLQVTKLRDSVENGGKNGDRERNNEDQDQNPTVKSRNPFPGREALVKKEAPQKQSSKESTEESTDYSH